MQIRRNLPIVKTAPVTNQKKTNKILQNRWQDNFTCENVYVNKKPLIDRKIIDQNQDINQYFKNISDTIFPDSQMAQIMTLMLQKGYISLSSSAYNNLSDPKSAIGLRLERNKTPIQYCAKLEDYIKNGIGVGINFSNLDNPIESIKALNNYFKYREPNLNRPPAGIALLNIDNAHILDFINLKNGCDYNDWSFDLSVVMDSEFLSKVDNNEDIILSNNTKIKARKIYSQLLNSMNNSGEPGIIFSDDKDFICDSCAASRLEENEGLNLAQINLSRFYNEKTKEIDYAFLEECSNILSKALKNIAPNGFISILGYQDLLNKMGLNYGEKKALDVLENCLKTIKPQTEKNNIRMAISPSGTTSRLLKTTPSIEPIKNAHASYWDELATMSLAQKYLEGGISKTINLKKNHNIEDIDSIIRYAQNNGIKGISVFPFQQN